MALMRLPRVSILFCACASLLAVQIGGLHVHGHAGGHAGDRGGAHLHFHGLHEHPSHSVVHHSESPAGGHGAERQPADSNGVAVTELGSSNWKLPDLDTDLHHGPCLEAAGAVREYQSFAEFQPAAIRRQWRQPSRGPPARAV